MDKEKTAAGVLAANNASSIYHKISRKKLIIDVHLSENLRVVRAGFIRTSFSDTRPA